MTDEDGLDLAGVVEQPAHVGAQLDFVVGVRLGWRRALAEAAHVRCQHAKAGVAQRRDLVAPGERELGKAVTQHDERSEALVDHAQLDLAACRDAVAWHERHDTPARASRSIGSRARRSLTTVMQAMSAQAERAPTETASPIAASARRPAILAVDDEPAVLAAVARDLRRGFGERFRVLRAGSGAEALELLRELRTRGDQVALLIADQRMPGMPGTEYLVAGAQARARTPSACC